jgi:hypothetical protein
MYFGTERTLSRMFVTPIDMNRHLIDENTKRCGDQKVVSCTSPLLPTRLELPASVF